MALLRILTVIMILLLASGTASGRQTTLSGSLSLLEEYDSNIDLTATNVRSGWFTVLTPSVILTSNSAKDSLSLGYAPGLRYNQDNQHDTQVDHYLTLTGSKQFSRRFSAKLTENYIRSNDYTYFVQEYVREEGAGIPLTAERGRYQYWTNGAALATDYEYARNSFLKLGYSNEILENDQPLLDNYVKHHPYLSLSYQVNPKWETELSYDFVRGNFDPAEDFNEHLIGALAHYQWGRHNLLFGSYQYGTLDYVGNRSGYALHRSDVGWQRQLGPHSTLELATGWSYADLERGDNESALNYVLDFKKTTAKSEISVGGKGGMDELQFDADPGHGLSKYWSVRGSANHQLAASFSSGLYASYRVDTFFQASPEYRDKSFVGGVNLTYAFLRWYAFAIGYSYRNLDSERPRNSYDDHRFYVQLSMGKELKRWL